MKKRAAVEVQFNWIFVLIIGAVILTFFIIVIKNMGAQAELKTAANVLTDLELITTSAEASAGSAQLIEMPKLDTTIDCNEIAIKGAKKDIANKVIFAPDLIKGRNLLAYSLEWRAPYRAANFLFLSSPEIRYIFIGDNDLFKEVNRTLPKKYIVKDGRRKLLFNKEFIDTSLYDQDSIENQNNYKVKFIFFDENPNGKSIPLKLKKYDVSAIYVDGDKDFGNIYFYQKNNSKFLLKGSSYYIEIPSIIGAIFSENIELYNCTMEKAFTRLRYISKIYQNRTNILKEYYVDKNILCYNIYSFLANGELKNMQGYALDSGALNTDILSLEKGNKDLYHESCPSMY